MSKHLPKTIKPLTADQRKVVIDQLRQDLTPIWEKFNGNTLKSSKHGITKLSTYLREMENDAYEKRYLMGSLDDYRDKIRTLKYNLKYNGAILFLRHAPDNIVDIEPRELGLGFVPLSNNSNNSNNFVDVQVTTKLEKSTDTQTDNNTNTNNLSSTSNTTTSSRQKQKQSELNTDAQTSISSNQHHDNANAKKNNNSSKSDKNLETVNNGSGSNRTYSPVQKIFEQEIINQKIRNESALDVALTVDKFKKNISRRIIGKAGGKSMVRCNRCGPRAYVETRSKQIRSADEPETTFCFCTKCERRWRC